MSDQVQLGPESPFSNGAKKGEGEQFTRDAFDHKGEWSSAEGARGRFEIDPFRFARYIVLGWIREMETFPYYELTVAGEAVYRKYYNRVAPDSDDWRDSDWNREADDDD